MRIDEEVVVEVPVDTAYNQWTQFESFPMFMDGVKQVEQLSDERLHWVAEVAGETKDWNARITRQVPNEVISWESEGGLTNNGTVIFKSAGDGKTEIALHMEFEPQNTKEAVGSAVGVPDRQVKGDLKRFKEFIESRGAETGAWRGEILHGDAKGKDA